MKNNKKRSGQAMVEYIIIVVLIAIAAIAAFSFFGDVLGDKVEGAGNALGANDRESNRAESSADALQNLDKDGLN